MVSTSLVADHHVMEEHTIPRRQKKAFIALQGRTVQHHLLTTVDTLKVNDEGPLSVSLLS